MKTPAFWQSRDSMTGRMLGPLGWIYTETTAWRLSRGPHARAAVPVICVGNLTVGGSGKTPIVRDLIRRLTLRGYRAGALSRGYGGRERGAMAVEPGRHSAAEVGDEPLLLARDAACWISADRGAGARAMVNSGIDAIVMDDGLQNPGLAQDLRLIVVDGARGFGNERGIPAGPLREAIGAGIGRADAMIVVGKDGHGLIERFSSQLTILQASIQIEQPEFLATRKLVAFAGIGRPEKFKDSLHEAGADIAAFHGFADHHPYSDAEIAIWSGQAERLGAVLVTTEKDWVRLTREQQRAVKAIAINIAWKDEPSIESLIDRLGHHG